MSQYWSLIGIHEFPAIPFRPQFGLKILLNFQKCRHPKNYGINIAKNTIGGIEFFNLNDCSNSIDILSQNSVLSCTIFGKNRQFDKGSPHFKKVQFF